MALKDCLQEGVRDDAMRLVPDSQRPRPPSPAEVRGLRGDDTRSKGSAPARGLSNSRASRPGDSLAQSPMVWAAIGAGAMLVLGGAVVLAVLLLR